MHSCRMWWYKGVNVFSDLTYNRKISNQTEVSLCTTFPVRCPDSSESPKYLQLLFRSLRRRSLKKAHPLPPQLKYGAAVLLYFHRVYAEKVQVRTGESVRVEVVRRRAVEICAFHCAERILLFEAVPHLREWVHWQSTLCRNERRRLPSWRPRFHTESTDVIYAHVIMNFLCSVAPLRLLRTL